jgi:POT family proton-dependent oligopeptide transporter
VGDHPLALYVLFFTEMWERFSFYGMRALLVYYMTTHVFLPGWREKLLGHATLMSLLGAVFGEMSVQEQSSQVYGLYTGFVYLTPLFGGMLADRYIGQRKSVYVGGLVMAAAQFLLMVESLFYVGLLLLILGNGFFKPNISTQVGALYPKSDDGRRDRAFMIFYVGINVGALLSPLVCGTLGEKMGWGWGFGSAGVGMLLGLVVYSLGQRLLAPDNVMKRAAAKSSAGPHERPPTHAPFTRSEWNRIVCLCVLCALNIPFWGVYEQQGNTLALWAKDNTDRMLFGWEVPASWFQAANPAFIFAFTPVIIGYWKWQATRGKEPSTVAKMAIGSLLLAVAYVVMLVPASSVGQGGKASMFWLLGSTLVLTLGELYLSPVGLSLVTKASPARIVSMMMGMWFISSFVGNYLSGYLGTYWEKMSKTAFFVMMAALALATGAAMIALAKPLKRALEGEDDASSPPGAPADDAGSPPGAASAA